MNGNRPDLQGHGVDRRYISMAAIVPQLYGGQPESPPVARDTQDHSNPRQSNTMQGHTAVIDCLRELLRGELAARDNRLNPLAPVRGSELRAPVTRAPEPRMQEETEHADINHRRICWSKPDVRHHITPGESVRRCLLGRTPNTACWL